MMETNKSIRFKFPLFTLGLTILSLSAYGLLVYLSKGTAIDPIFYPQLGAPYALQIYEGQYWGVIINSFFHAYWYQLAINILGLWIFAAFLERRIGWKKLFLFGLFSSVFTSLIQLTLTNDAGLGLSGVNFALFGLIFTLSFRNSFYRLKGNYYFAALMVGLLLFFFIQNKFSGWNIGIETMLSGILWGLMVGWTKRFKPFMRFFILTIPFSLALLTLFYAPWSAVWNCHRGLHFHKVSERDDAIEYYKRAISIDPDYEVATLNLKLLTIDDWSDKAYYHHTKGNYTEARVYYEKILELDPKNHWAKKNLKQLP